MSGAQFAQFRPDPPALLYRQRAARVEDAAGRRVDRARHLAGYRPEGAEKLGLFLQNHGNPVAFRNIWVVEK